MNTRTLTLLSSLLMTSSCLAESPVQEATPSQLVDALNGVFGPQTDQRAVHAKGIVLEGTFTPSPEAAALSKAPHFASKVKVTARFSNFPGVTVVPDADAASSPRGLALKFHLPDGSDTDLVTHSFDGFPAPTADEFRRFLIALGTSGPGSAKPTPADVYLGAHPVAKRFLENQPPPPVSYGTIAYFGVNAFRFTNAVGHSELVRYRITPEGGERFLDKEQVASAAPDYLARELREHSSREPLRFVMSVQIATKEDRIDDPSTPWPAGRKRVTLGVLELNRIVDDSEAKERALLFLPLALPAGIEAADPMLNARSTAYPVSFQRRHGMR
jgi:catalase